MAAILFVVGFLLLLNIVHKRDTPDALITTVVVFSLFIWLSTEILSRFNLIYQWSIITLWVLAVAGLVYYSFNKKCLRFHWAWRPQKDLNTVIILCGCFLVAVSFFICVYVPPNNWDSMTYHLTRMLYWLQHHNVEYFPTENLRQLFQPPLAEFYALHLYLLTGSDVFLNAIQLVFLVFVAIVAYRFAMLWTTNKTHALLAFLFVLSLPIALLESNSTQNDIISGFWMLSFAYLVVRYFRSPDIKVWVLMAATLAFGLLTKAPNLLFVVGFLPFFLLYQQKHALPLKYIIVFFVIVVAINAPHMIRNKNALGAYVGSGEKTDIHLNEKMTPTYLMSNVIRNVAIEFTPYHEAPRLWVNDKIERIHHKLKVDINDPKISFIDWNWSSYYSPGNQQMSEDSAPNTMHSVLLLAAVFIVLVSFKKTDITLLLVMACVTLSFFIFCFFIKWQPWHSRLHITYFFVLSPFVSVALSFVKRPIAQVLLFAALFICGCYTLAFSQKKPLFTDDNIFVLDNQYDRNPTQKDILLINEVLD